MPITYLSSEDVRAPTRNPRRIPGRMTEEELEVLKLYKGGVEQKVEKYIVEVHEYWAPFNYPNVIVELGREGSGAEVNTDGVELDIPPFGAITIIEDEPIVNVTVIGSACVAPGYILLYAEPIEWKYPRTGVKMRIDGLWGEHILGDLWRAGIDEGFRRAGLSSAHFEIPPSKKITIMAGSGMEVDWNPDPIGHPQNPKVSHKNLWNDPHYCIRIIRVGVKKSIPW